MPKLTLDVINHAYRLTNHLCPTPTVNKVT